MKALIVVDVQNDFCEGGTLEVKNASEIIPIINNLITLFKKNKQFIISTKDWHPKNHKSFAVNSNKIIGEIGELNGLPQVWWPEHCIEYSFGAELHPELLYIENTIYKGTDPNVDSYSAFFDNGRKRKTQLGNILRKKGIHEIYIVGLATDYCVKYTVLDAIDLDFKVNIVEDACKGVNLQEFDSELALKEIVHKGAHLIKSTDIKF